jgi:DNA-binding NtrC family response regulator
MPGMNGLELSKIVAAERPGIKVVLMSGDSAVKVAGIPFLQKPFQLSDLRQILGSVLGFTPGLR